MTDITAVDASSIERPAPVTTDDGGDRPPRLPRGRHHLSRDDVRATQRARILSALADTMMIRGYVDTPVSAVITAAGVSRETFYQQFTSKEDCFVAALEDTVNRLTSGIRAQAAADPGPPMDTFDRILGTYLAALDAAPATARLVLIETFAAGPEIMQRRSELHARLLNAVAHLFAVGDNPFGRFCCEALTDSIATAITTRLVCPGPPNLTELRRPLVAVAGRLIGPR